MRTSHKLVPFMASPIDMATMNGEEIDPEMDAVLSIDTTRGTGLLTGEALPLHRMRKRVGY